MGMTTWIMLALAAAGLLFGLSSLAKKQRSRDD